MNNTPKKFVLRDDQPCQVRPAQNVTAEFESAVRQVCEANPSIVACYLFDIRRAQSDSIELGIALRLEDESTQMDRAAEEFQHMLSKFPEVAERTIIISAEPFGPICAGSEFYLKK